MDRASSARRAWHGPAVIAAGLVAAVAARTGGTYGSIDALLSRLSSIVPARSVEPRLSVEAAYRPYDGADASNRLPARLTKADAARLDALLHSGSVSAAAIAQLLLGHAELAVVQFERSGVARSPVDAAAAYYTRGLATKSLNDFARALQALSLAEPSAAAAFNRGLILEQLFDHEAAADAWREYLAIDGSSQWAEEAREHLRREAALAAGNQWESDRLQLLQAAAAGDARRIGQLVDKHRASARRLIEAELLPSWGAAALCGDASGAAAALRSARQIAAVLRARSGEAQTSDAIEEIAAAEARSRAAAKRFASVYVAYGNGRQEIDDTDYQKALAELDCAAVAAPDGSAAESLVALQTVIARYLLYDFDGALRLIDATARRFALQAPRYQALFGHLAWVRGLLLAARNERSLAMAEYERALPIYERLGECEGQVAQHSNLADSLDVLGETARAALHRRSALRIAEGLDDLRRLHPLLGGAADAALDASLPAAALQFQDRLVRISRQSGNPLRIADALVIRSTILRGLGRRSEALGDLAEATRMVPSIADAKSRGRMSAEAAAAEAFAYRGADDKRSIASLTRAIDDYDALDFRVYVPQLLLERGRIRMRHRDRDGAERDFANGIHELEQQRRQVNEPELRISYLDRAERLFSELAESLLRHGQSAEAFDLLERSRARELLDSSTGEWAQPMTLPQIQRRIPPGAALVTYTVTPSSLITFTVRRGSIWVVRQAGGEAILQPLLDQVADGTNVDDGLERLSQLLVGQAGPRDGERLVIVPDAMLSGVPFAGLRERGAYLVEHHEIRVAPSATLAVRLCDTAPRRGTSILVISSPDAVPSLDLPPLTHAEAEVASIAPMYARHRVLRPADPAIRSLLAEARGYDVVHFGGHAVIDRRHPEQSRLILGNGGAVTAGEIETARLASTRLVVLAGCNTSAGQAHRSEGVLSLARSFLAAGVPAVVGTTAPVEDGAAARLLIAFHTAYARGLDAAAALRSAQLQMLRGGHRDWTRFEVIGGVCNDAKSEDKEGTKWASR